MSAARSAWAKEAYPDEQANSLAKLRLERGFSQTQLAEAVGTSQSHIAKIEAGQIRIYLDTASRLANALNIPLDRLNFLLASNNANSTSRGA